MVRGPADGLANYGTVALYDCVVASCGKVRFGGEALGREGSAMLLGIKSSDQ